jgi:hypothetical protein
LYGAALIVTGRLDRYDSAMVRRRTWPFLATSLLIEVACHASGVDLAAVSKAIDESSRRAELPGSATVLGWHTEFAADRFRWRECTSETSCSLQDRETMAGNVVSVAPVGQTTVTGPDGQQVVEVQKITLRRDGSQ